MQTTQHVTRLSILLHCLPLNIPYSPVLCNRRQLGKASLVYQACDIENQRIDIAGNSQYLFYVGWLVPAIDHLRQDASN